MRGCKKKSNVFSHHAYVCVCARVCSPSMCMCLWNLRGGGESITLWDCDLICSLWSCVLVVTVDNWSMPLIPAPRLSTGENVIPRAICEIHDLKWKDLFRSFEADVIIALKKKKKKGLFEIFRSGIPSTSWVSGHLKKLSTYVRTWWQTLVSDEGWVTLSQTWQRHGEAEPRWCGCEMKRRGRGFMFRAHETRRHFAMHERRPN